MAKLLRCIADDSKLFPKLKEMQNENPVAHTKTPVLMKRSHTSYNKASQAIFKVLEQESSGDSETFRHT
eukprot:11010065-Alexandrium_andersonii.AAC.1